MVPAYTKSDDEADEQLMTTNTKQTEDISFLLPVREFPDKSTKWLLEFRENVKGLLQIVASDLVDRLDFGRLEQVNQTFIPDNLREQEADVVYLVPFSGTLALSRALESGRYQTNHALLRL